MSQQDDIAVAEAYYDSDDADRFYFTIWGGEDIPVGMYKTPDEPIAPASQTWRAAAGDSAPRPAAASARKPSASIA